MEKIVTYYQYNPEYAPAIKSGEAQKFGFNPKVDMNAQILSFINKANFIVGGIQVILAGIMAALGTSSLPALGAVAIAGGIVYSIYKIGEQLVKILEMRGLLADSDQKELMMLVSDSKELSAKLKQYKTYGDIPDDLQNELKDYVKRTYIATNQMKDALRKIRSA